MSRISEVVKNKNRIEKLNKARRKDELSKLRMTSAFKARLYDELKYIDVVLEDAEVEFVVITVQDKYLALFSSAIYSEDLAEYEVEQYNDEANQFKIKRRSILF